MLRGASEMQEDLVKDIEQLFENVLDEELEGNDVKGLPECIESD